MGWVRRNMLSDWGKSAASMASQATATVKATTTDLAGDEFCTQNEEFCIQNKEFRI